MHKPITCWMSAETLKHAIYAWQLYIHILHSIIIRFQTNYLYIGFTFNKLIGTTGYVLNFSEIRLFVKENNNFDR